MILNDEQIYERVATQVIIDPYEPGNLQPSSYDVTLGDEFWTHYKRDTPIVLADKPSPRDLGSTWKAHGQYGQYTIKPMEFVLAATRERIMMPIDLVGRLEGKSSIGRLGLIVHATAGYVDPGFVGWLTLEMFNLSPRPIVLDVGMRIAQISFSTIKPPAKPYGHRDLGSHYQNQGRAPEPARLDDRS